MNWNNHVVIVTGANIMTDGGMTIQLINQARYASKALEGKLDDEMTR